MKVHLFGGGDVDVEEGDIREVISQDDKVILKLNSGLGWVVKAEEYNNIKQNIKTMCDKCNCESCPCECGCDCCKNN